MNSMGGMMFFHRRKKSSQGSELPVLLGVGDTPVFQKNVPGER